MPRNNKRSRKSKTKNLLIKKNRNYIKNCRKSPNQMNRNFVNYYYYCYYYYLTIFDHNFSHRSGSGHLNGRKHEVGSRVIYDLSDLNAIYARESINNDNINYFTTFLILVTLRNHCLIFAWLWFAFFATATWHIHEFHITYKLVFDVAHKITYLLRVKQWVGLRAFVDF